MSKKYEELANAILKNVGGSDNVSYCFNCATRIRIVAKDKSLINEDELKKTKGVLGTTFLGDQFQIIIGNDVKDVYAKVCEIGNLECQKEIDENLDEVNENLTLVEKIKKFGKKAIAYISSTMSGILPVFIAAGMAKTIAVILGPNMLNIISAESDAYMVLNFLYSTTFYFLPVYLGYSACRALKYNPVYGIFLACFIIVPDFVALVGVRDSISVFGIPAQVAAYSQTFLPIMLGVWAGKYVLRLLEKYSPKAISAIVVPLLFVLIMAPIMLCVCAPLGNAVGNVIGELFIMFDSENVIIGGIGVVLISMAMPYLLTCGMHLLLINFAIIAYSANGFDSFVLPPTVVYSWAIYGLALGAFLKIKDKEEKSAALSYFITGAVGGISEPTIYGIALKYKGGLKALTIACGLGGVVCAILRPKMYVITTIVNLFSLMAPWPGGSTSNIVFGSIVSVVSLIFGLIAAYFLVDYNTDNK